MKNRPLLTVALFALFLLISLLLNIRQMVHSRWDTKRIEALSQKVTNGQASILTRYVHDSIEHVVIKEIKVTTTAEKNTAVGSLYLDTLTRAIKVASKHIDEVTSINAKLEAENLALKKSKTNNRFEYQDKTLSLSYSPDSNLLDFRYNISLNTAKYWKRNWFLSPKEYYIDMFSEDPRVKINSVKRYSIAEQKPSKFGLGFNLGYSYSPFLNKWEPTLGIGVNYNLIRF